MEINAMTPIHWGKSFTLKMTASPAGKDFSYERTTATGKAVSGSVKTAALDDGSVKVSASRTGVTGTTISGEKTYSAEQVSDFKTALRDRIRDRDIWPAPAEPQQAHLPDPGFTMYYDPETGTVVCGMPPRDPATTKT